MDRLSEDADYEMVTLAETSSTETGEYKLSGRDLMQLQIKASAPGAANVAVSVRDPARNRVYDKEKEQPPSTRRKLKRDIVLLPAVQLKGRVIDETEKPVAGAAVTFAGDAGPDRAIAAEGS